MSAAGYTTIYNEVLRDRTLSLEAKGLFAVIKSFVGLPDFALSKRRLGYACSDSAYLLNAAWKELKQKGYLQHYFSQAENGALVGALPCHSRTGQVVRQNEDKHRHGQAARFKEVRQCSVEQVFVDVIASHQKQCNPLQRLNAAVCDA